MDNESWQNYDTGSTYSNKVYSSKLRYFTLIYDGLFITFLTLKLFLQRFTSMLTTYSALYIFYLLNVVTLLAGPTDP